MTGPVRVFSNSTYAIYLIHFPLQLLLACLFTYTAQPVPFYSPWFFVVFMLGTVALSLGINRFYEQPVQAWLRRGARTSARPRLSAGHAQGG